MAMITTVVSAEIGLRVATAQHGLVPLIATFSYSTSDPLAVRIAFRTGPGDPVEWTFARELLSRGIRGREGAGDVQVWPADPVPGDQHGRVVNIQLSSAFGQARFEAPAREVTAFLRATSQVVPEGSEIGHMDIDAGIAGLLG